MVVYGPAQAAAKLRVGMQVKIRRGGGGTRLVIIKAIDQYSGN
ncbi:unnamed protein product, partial [Rotaria socialis]